MMKALLSIVLLCLFTSLYAQTKYDFSTPAALSGTPWKNTATIIVGGVSYTIGGGINGDYTNTTTGGNGNSASLTKSAAGGDNFYIRRTDGKRFQFYGLWIKQSSMSPYPNTPPFYTVRFMNGTTELKNYAVNDKNSTKTYTENLGVTYVSFQFNALSSYTIDDLIVGPAIPSSDASLSKLTLTNGTLSPAFNKTVYNYSVTLNNYTDKINLSAVANDEMGATISVNGQTVKSGSSVPVSLSGETTIITIICTAENGSEKTYQITVTRPAPTAYCQPTSVAKEGDVIKSISLAGEDNTSLSDMNMGGSASGYVYRSAKPAVNIKRGKSYNGTITTSGLSYVGDDGEHVKIWIDFNDNLSFEPEELVYDAPALFTSSGPLNYMITVPADAKKGDHRMRVRLIYEGVYNETAFTGCSNEDYGETYDYQVKVVSFDPMPLTLVSFNAVQKSNNVQLTWNTMEERDVFAFEIEKSGDGKRFSKVGAVSARNNRIGESYSWMDYGVPTGYEYYRLKMVDRDGKFAYSQVVRVGIQNSESKIEVAPNPILNHTIHLRMNQIPKGRYKAELFNSGGQSVYAESWNNTSEISKKSIVLPGKVPMGIYKLIIAGEAGQNYSQTIFIK